MEAVNVVYKENKESFSKLLLHTPFEEKANDLFDSLINIKYNHQAEIKDKYKYELAQAMLLLMTDNNTALISLKKKNKIIISNEIHNVILNSLKQEYINEGFNVGYNEEEAKQKLEKGDENVCREFFEFLNEWDPTLIEDSYNKEIKKTPYEWSCYDKRFKHSLGAFALDYSFKHPIKKEITIKYLKDTIKWHEIVDATCDKRKNAQLYIAILQFIRVGFLCNNQHYRLAFECLKYFEMIDPQLIKIWDKGNTKYKIEAYMKKLFLSTKQKFPF